VMPATQVAGCLPATTDSGIEGYGDRRASAAAGRILS
jgi:hypothetical protein